MLNKFYFFFILFFYLGYPNPAGKICWFAKTLSSVVDINFTQTFKSDEYSDIGVKELVWVKNGSDWKIIKETWIPRKKTT